MKEYLVSGELSYCDGVPVVVVEGVEGMVSSEVVEVLPPVSC